MDLQAILRLFENQDFEIDDRYAVQQLQMIYFNSKLNSKEFYEKQYLRLSSINILSNDGLLSTVGSATEINGVKNIAEVSLEGIMLMQDQMCSPGIRSLDRTLRSLYNSANVDGILIHADSGGGQSQAGAFLNNAIGDRNKPVLVHTTMLGSAAVRGTLQAEQIISDSKSTLVGSIGSMATLSKDFLSDESKTVDVYSDTSQRKNEEIRAAKQGDFSLLVKRLTRNDKFFMDEVRKYADLKGDEATIKETLSGALFDSVQARRRGLISGIGSVEVARQRLRTEIKIAN